MKMRKLFVGFVVLAAYLPIVPQCVVADDMGDKAAINRVLDQLEKSHLEENVDLLGSLLSDSGFALVMRKPADSSRALVFGKSRMLELTAKRWEQIDFLEHKHTQRKIIIDGPIAESRSVIRDRTGQRDPANVPVLHILANEDGRWRLVFASTLVSED